jgi:hypothetical protein
MDEYVNDIKDAVAVYLKTGQYIVEESTKFKDNLNSKNGLESSDIETMLKQIDAWSGSFGVITDRMNQVLKSRKPS